MHHYTVSQHRRVWHEQTWKLIRFPNSKSLSHTLASVQWLRNMWMKTEKNSGRSYNGNTGISYEAD
jgi:hypothetical protein